MSLRRRVRPHYHRVRRAGIRTAAELLRTLPVPSTVVGPPKQVVSDVAAWSATRADVMFTPLAPAGELPIPDPVTPEGVSFYDAYCRGTTQRTLHRTHDGRLYCERPARFVVAMDDGRVLGCNGAIVGPGDALLLELSPEFDSERYIPGRHSLLSRVHLPPPLHVAGTVAVLATLADSYFAHWMMDLLPRIGLLEAAGFDLGEFDAFYLAQPDAPFREATLAAAGVPAAKILDCRANPHVRAERLVVPSPLSEVFQASETSCDYLNALYGPPEEDMTPRRRLLVSRRATTHRRLVNEDELAAALAPLGFERIEPQMLPLDEQARLFAEAEFVVAPLGSAIANYVYCRPGATIVEIQNERAVQTCSAAIASVRGLRYAYLFGDGIDSDARPLAEDMTVEIPKLLRLLGTLGV